MSSTGESRLPGPERRAQLLAVALDVFSAAGYHETSMNDIAQRAGVTKPVLYQHFAGKRDLYLEIVNDVSARLVDIVSATPTPDPTAPAATVDVLTGRLTGYYRFVGSERRAFALLFGSVAPRDHVIGKAIRAAEDGVVSAIASTFPRQVDDRERWLTAEMIAGAAEAAARNWASTGYERSPEEVAADVADFLWNGLRKLRD